MIWLPKQRKGLKVKGNTEGNLLIFHEIPLKYYYLTDFLQDKQEG